MYWFAFQELNIDEDFGESRRVTLDHAWSTRIITLGNTGNKLIQMVVEISIFVCIFQMKEEATIRDMESKELTERNQQLKRETGELR